MNSRVLGGLCAIAAFGLDQGTKALALNTPALERGVEVLPFLNLVRVLNDGVSFGMLGGIVPWWGLIALAGVIVAWLLIWLWRAPDRLTFMLFVVNAVRRVRRSRGFFDSLVRYDEQIRRQAEGLQGCSPGQSRSR